ESIQLQKTTQNIRKKTDTKTTHEIHSRNYTTSAAARPMDSAVARTSRPCRNWTKISDRPAIAWLAGQWSSPSRRRPGFGENAGRENNGRVHSNRLSTVAIHARSPASRLDWHADL